jgi:SAM-dependent methyltransferase
VHEIGGKDGDNVIDWSRTRADYSTWRPDYPDALYARLRAHDVGVAGQRVLDVGCGTGFLGRRFAAQGARVVGVDIASEQVADANARARAAQLDARFFVASAEATAVADHRFDVVIAGQCWLYFDKARVVPEVLRVLAAGGRLVTCHFSWLPREDELARASEQLILRFNPKWSAADWDGVIPDQPRGTHDAFACAQRIVFDEDIPFTRDSWRGRIRASRGVGATLSPAEIERFDAEHDALLRERAGERFTIKHRVDAHVLTPRASAR